MFLIQIVLYDADTWNLYIFSFMCVCHQYIETLDLSGLISITDDSSQDRNLDAVRLNLQMKDGNIKFTVREYIENI